MQIEKRRIGQIMGGEQLITSIDQPSLLSQDRSAVLSHDRSGNFPSERGTKIIRRKKKSRVGSVDSRKSLKSGKSSRSKSKTKIKRKRHSVYKTQGVNSKNSTIVHQCEASSCSARPHGGVATTQREPWVPGYQAGGIL